MAGADADFIHDTYSEHTTILAGAGDDRVTVGSITSERSNYDFIDLGAGNDYFQTNSGYGTVTGGMGDDIISLKGYSYNSYIVYTEGDGNDTITGFYASDTLGVDAANYSTVTSDSDLIIQVGSGSITLKDRAHYTNNIVVHSGTEITNDDTSAVLTGTDFRDTITNYAAYATISAGKGNDIIGSFNYTGRDPAKHVIIDSGEGHDSIMSDGSYASINAGAGDDTIIASGYNLTVIGGTGDDTINLNGATYNYLIQYNEGDGDDTITGFNDNDTLEIAADTCNTVKTDNDIIVQVGGSDIILDGAASISNFNLTFADADENELMKINNTYKYSGGNKNITNYTTGEKLNWSTDLTGIDIFSGDNFVFSSSSGDLTIQNVRNKVIDFSYNGTTIAYLAKASGELSLDASGLSQFLILAGGNNASNNFSAGSGGSWLWGGIGGNDTLKGGSGSDVFYFGKNDGFDVINNASSSDIVNLYDVSINDITTLDTSNNQITIGLNTGANLQINSAENISAKITMSEGSVNFNHSTGQWNLA